MVDPEEVRRVAHLARLGLAPDDEQALVGHLVSILQHFEVLQGVDTEGVAPMTHPLAAHGTAAPDEPEPFPRPREGLVELTEHAREGFFVVPRVLEDAGEDGPEADPEPAADDGEPTPDGGDPA